MRITDMKVFRLTLDPKLGRTDRPYVFVKLETNQGVIGWGEATLEGKAAAAMACVNDLKDFIIGSDPMQVEHLYQLMYVGASIAAARYLARQFQVSTRRSGTFAARFSACPSYELLGRSRRQPGSSRLLPCVCAHD